eukprot:scaffold20203_cov127-Isochrysis_galbana.AAC.6
MDSGRLRGARKRGRGKRRAHEHNAARLHGNGGGYQLSGRMRTTIVSAHTHICILRYPVSVILSLCEYPHTGPIVSGYTDTAPQAKRFFYI